MPRRPAAVRCSAIGSEARRSSVRRARCSLMESEAIGLFESDSGEGSGREGCGTETVWLTLFIENLYSGAEDVNSELPNQELRMPQTYVAPLRSRVPITTP